MEYLQFIAISTGKALVVWGLTLTFILINIYLERKVCALIQDRVGPNRAHVAGIRLFGFVLNFADAVKLLFKEDLMPSFVNKRYYLIAPAIIMTIALMGAAVIPLADDVTIGGLTIRMQVMDLNVGILYILAITSLSVYSLVLAGWGSNSKYPLFAAMRSSAQMISYEISMGLSLVGLIMVFGSVSMGDIARAQGALIFGFIPAWGVVVQPLGALLFFVSAMAELNRNPFDLPEGESEIIGFHIEYSAMKFALFFMGEYANIFVAAAAMTTLFLGGWQIPWVSTELIKSHASVACIVVSSVAIAGAATLALLLVRFYRVRPYRWNDIRDLEPLVLYSVLGAIVLAGLGLIGVSLAVPFSEAARAIVAFVLQFGAFCTKALVFCFVVVWIRWTLPRFRYDQLMALGWKIMLPLGLANLLITGMLLLLKKGAF